MRSARTTLFLILALSLTPLLGSQCGEVDRDRTFYFISDRGQPPGSFNLFRYEPSGITQLTSRIDINEHPEAAGDRIYFIRQTRSGSAEVHVMPKGGGSARPITDADTSRFEGFGHPEIEGGHTYMTATKPNGGVVLLRDGSVIVDHGGRTQAGHPQLGPTGPNGSLQLYFSSNRGDSAGAVADFEIWKADPDGTNQQPLTDNGLYDAGATPGPDGRVAFARNDTANPCAQHLWTMNPDGTDQQQVTGHPSGYVWPTRWVGPDSIQIVSDRDPDDDGSRTDLYHLSENGGTWRGVVTHAALDQTLLATPFCASGPGSDASLSASPTTVEVGQTVSFSVGPQSALDEAGYDEFDFAYGDGTEESRKSPSATHSYASPGTYRPTVTMKISACAPAGTKEKAGPPIHVVGRESGKTEL